MQHKISHSLITAEAYLSHEKASLDTRHEFIDGYVVAMAGGSIRHGKMITNIARLLGNHLVGKPYDVFSSDVKLKVESAFVKSFRYPDVMVSCEPDRQYEDMCESATVLVEVLSESTELTDRVYKSAEYGHVLNATQGEYLVVDPDRPVIEKRMWHDGRFEVVATYGTGEIITLESLKLDLSMDDLYPNCPP
ncbi:Uma2 family endonuclease [Endozoicomonas arenosclerae]|uniref:Uma2 family endonuclease n=1 Tax=Endozoicomonas arenosclerae TaxID=1633495 RepID=UPI0007844BEF|nr:Uma2 family endonuclease [Endozoicomonas arenosclerae]